MYIFPNVNKNLFATQCIQRRSHNSQVFHGTICICCLFERSTLGNYSRPSSFVGRFIFADYSIMVAVSYLRPSAYAFLKVVSIDIVKRATSWDYKISLYRRHSHSYSPPKSRFYKNLGSVAFREIIAIDSEQITTSLAQAIRDFRFSNSRG